MDTLSLADLAEASAAEAAAMAAATRHGRRFATRSAKRARLVDLEATLDAGGPEAMFTQVTLAEVHASELQEPGDGASPLDRHHGAALLCWLSDSTCIGLIELERAPGIGQLRLHAASSKSQCTRELCGANDCCNEEAFVVQVHEPRGGRRSFIARRAGVGDYVVFAGRHLHFSTALVPGEALREQALSRYFDALPEATRRDAVVCVGRISLTWPSLLAAAAADPERAGAEPPLAWPGARTSFEGRGMGPPRSRLGAVSDLPCVGPSRLEGEEVLSPPAGSPFAGSPFDAALSAFGAAPAGLGLGLGRFGAASLDALRRGSTFESGSAFDEERSSGPLALSGHSRPSDALDQEGYAGDKSSGASSENEVESSVRSILPMLARVAMPTPRSFGFDELATVAIPSHTAVVDSSDATVAGTAGSASASDGASMLDSLWTSVTGDKEYDLHDRRVTVLTLHMEEMAKQAEVSAKELAAAKATIADYDAKAKARGPMERKLFAKLEATQLELRKAREAKRAAEARAEAQASRQASSEPPPGVAAAAGSSDDPSAGLLARARAADAGDGRASLNRRHVSAELARKSAIGEGLAHARDALVARAEAAEEAVRTARSAARAEARERTEAAAQRLSSQAGGPR
ncbi:hypothetical protein EMIHUDRAFT_449330 [Emiliania huxleyi CCMP1516]|uniref:Uncharacterized protein n=2 Tax=Emiliania huxleyi TaxID=2903 RepID=A0A0D3KEV0_EMIH1|nr:hypothetical protein EMIHUDRAFT_449330 [Emiliania huxleyi CCMP1516]EOD34285.1 hypothetical protein EMIHUDRAFT_449330 [Emiliania huxleyi CCMP1516]|eukprot:XP_005786714.1 hypothetical protein EMIHUDRAFT_449330 [Emiliania huxleyi CCMP1516]